MGARVDSAALEPAVFLSGRLEQVFARCFADSYHTNLQGGAPEPLYQPAGERAVLLYREDYFASALHEVAHWCLAGPDRRQQVDFGYWYAPDGRSDDQQRAFEQVEFRPQALEWFFSQACAYRFHVSVDNLHGAGDKLPDTAPFRRQVVDQARHWQQVGLPPRAAQFYHALGREFGTVSSPQQLRFDLADLE